MSQKVYEEVFIFGQATISCDFSFAVNEGDIQCHLEDRQLKDALKDKKLFIVDYRDFDGVQGKENYTVLILSLEKLVISQLKCFVLKPYILVTIKK